MRFLRLRRLRRLRGRRDQRGFATTEFVAGVGVLLIPTLLAVVALSSWPQRQAMANTAASEAAREVVVKQGRVEPNHALALDVARETADQFLAGSSDSVVGARVLIPACARTNCRGETVTVEVDVELPLLSVPFFGQLAPTYTYTATARERVEDYRGF